jgi:predicted nucleotidyltransferase
MFYTLDEIKSKVKPIAEKYDIPAVYVFGSYARGEASENSDIDFAADYRGSKIKSLINEGGFFGDLERTFGENNVDLVDLECFDEELYVERNESLVKNVREDMVSVYEKR